MSSYNGPALTAHPLPRDKGGGIYFEQSSTNLSHLTINANSAKDGSGVYLYESDIFMKRTVISGNISNIGNGDGGGIYSMQSNPVFHNVTITGNMADGDGPGIYTQAYSEETTMILKNCILWANGYYQSTESADSSQIEVF